MRYIRMEFGAGYGAVFVRFVTHCDVNRGGDRAGASGVEGSVSRNKRRAHDRRSVKRLRVVACTLLG